MTEYKEIISGAVLLTVFFGGSSLLVKWVLNSMKDNIDGLRESWVQYTERLTAAIEATQRDVSSLKTDLQAHKAKDERALDGLEDTIDRRFEQLSEQLYGLKHG